MAGQDLGEDNYAVEQEPDLIVQTLTADLETLKQNIMQKEGQGEGAAEREEDAADGEEAVSCCHRTPHCHRSSVHWNLIQDWSWLELSICHDNCRAGSESKAGCVDAE
ncbi:hypothetical protein PF003_g14718 [Phytophthora fragariae]|nr:hypothetical protein PF003_g14718 [Phytophthora fragariae]